MAIIQTIPLSGSGGGSYLEMTTDEAIEGTNTEERVISAKVLNDTIDNKIPTVNNAKLTIQKNGTTVKTFTANASANVTCNIEVPTKVSDLDNDSGFLTEHQDISGLETKANAITGLSVSGKVITYTKGDGSTGNITTQDTNTWTAFKGATSSANGTAGYVPAPTKGNQDKFFKADGTWATPTDTTYSVVTTSANGLMSSTDKTKLDGLSNYTLPTASSTLGGVKTTSTVTSTSGLTACPIISGVVYYKDTNTTYSFSNNAPTLAWGTTSTIGTVGGTDLTVTMPANPNTDTHWTTTLYAGAKDAKSNAVTTNGNAYIKLYDNNTVRSQLNIKGSGATTVTTDANGVITISSTDNNTTYSKLSQFTNDSGYITGITKAMVTNALGYTPPTSDTNTWTALKGSTTSAAGTAGYAPAPAAGAANRYLRCDGTWQVPPDNNTTYSNMTAATADAAGKAGLVPAPGKGKQTSFLRGDGTWVVPTNTTYSFTNKAATLAWNTAVTIATVGGTDITVKLPANPNTNTTYSAGTNMSLSGTTFATSSTPSFSNVTVTNNSSNGVLFGSYRVYVG